MSSLLTLRVERNDIYLLDVITIQTMVEKNKLMGKKTLLRGSLLDGVTKVW